MSTLNVSSCPYYDAENGDYFDGDSDWGHVPLWVPLLGTLIPLALLAALAFAISMCVRHRRKSRHHDAEKSIAYRNSQTPSTAPVPASASTAQGRPQETVQTKPTNAAVPPASAAAASGPNNSTAQTAPTSRPQETTQSRAANDVPVSQPSQANNPAPQAPQSRPEESQVVRPGNAPPTSG